ncbi:hypothetical protein BCR39DRAFT_511283 [Naematelia encephala]|uniref:DNA replication complex GINS protein SLD5 n=1 Tax=Naematelia encephala TaxID=71784 RepID=A0A1Y2BNA4_9TREE|nr:hypothetical protein BCR39DRAFT_511283 [Naematelia encephala]
MSFFDNEEEEDESPFNASVAAQPAEPIGGWSSAEGSSSRYNRNRASSLVSATESGIGSRSFLSRLESTVSPHGKGRSGGLFNQTQDEDEVGVGIDDEEDDEDELDDVSRMGKVWVRERGTVDVMRWEGDLIDTLFDKLEQQAKMVNTLHSDPQTSEEEHFKLVLVQTEMERVKFLVRSYVRTRLSKIEKYSHYIVLHPEIHQLLSGAELLHAKRYTELLHTHFQHSVLDSLPEWLRKMDDTYGDGLSMVTSPNKNVPVLIYCQKDCGEILLEGGESAALAKGTTHLVKYSLVERWVQLGWAEVI